MALQEYSPQRHPLLNLQVYHRIRKVADDPPPHSVLHYYGWRESPIDINTNRIFAPNLHGQQWQESLSHNQNR